MGVQKTSSKHNQQFNEILINTARTREIIGFLDNDLIISSNNHQNINQNINQNNIILNKNICINSSGELIISKNIQFLDINSLENPLTLYNDENNLIWGNDVVITDSTLQPEIESLNLNKISLKEIEFTNTNLNLNLNQTFIPRIAFNIPKDLSVSYNLTLPNQKPKNNQILSYSSSNDSLNWVDLPYKTPIGSIILFAKKEPFNISIPIPKGWLLCDGSILCINEYPELYSIIGNTYCDDNDDNDQKDFIDSFKLPNLNKNVNPINENFSYIICCE